MTAVPRSLYLCNSVGAVQREVAGKTFTAGSTPPLRQGVTVNTSPTHYNMFRVVRMTSFNGKYMMPIGGLLGD